MQIVFNILTFRSLPKCLLHTHARARTPTLSLSLSLYLSLYPLFLYLSLSLSLYLLNCPSHYLFPSTIGIEPLNSWISSILFQPESQLSTKTIFNNQQQNRFSRSLSILAGNILKKFAEPKVSFTLFIFSLCHLISLPPSYLNWTVWIMNFYRMLLALWYL